jgi:phage-related protein (TIGR01555 family)
MDMAQETNEKKVAILDAATLDSFANQLARIGFGTTNLLEGTEYTLTRLTRNYYLMLALYRTNWIARKVIDTYPEDMMKNRFELTCQVSPEEIDQFDKVINKTHTEEKLLTALKWGRLFGGAGAIIMIEGHQDILDEPLDYNDVTPGSFKGLLVFDRWSGISPGAELITDLNNPPEFGLPASYHVTTETAQSFDVDASRVLRFCGRQLPAWEWQAEMRWGMSEFEIIYDELKKRDNTSWNIASLVFRANIIELKMNNLVQMLTTASPDVQQKISQILSMQNQMMSNQGMIITPEGPGMRTHQYSFAGINEVYQSFMLDVCGACEIPMTRLFGRTISGLGQSNEGDERIYYDNVGHKQKRELKPQLDKLMPVIAMSTWGDVPDDLDFRFPSVRTMSAEEMAELAAKKVEAISKPFNDGVYGRKTYLKELRQMEDETGLFSNVTDKMIEDADDEVPSEKEFEGFGGQPGATGELTPIEEPSETRVSK